ncbi:group III truncated hemoglobin [Paradesertivirga mongoliensis]|uniref:Group III truncated hemoglobin n=1 Tax=Paradesertivirga mongoliensis TaxID=2100740 RepID=A0ABW4ZPD6_9SPHI|nr:group III truncated hemoglobin [Pedobacter mongoliensis]
MGEELKKSSDILTEADVSVLVNAFYDKVREDPLLRDVFNDVIKDNWPAHLNRMIDFWSTVLLYTRTYKDDPMPKHLPLPIGKEHFDRWLALFDETISEHFDGQIAENARKRTASIASIMQAVKGIPR